MFLLGYIQFGHGRRNTVLRLLGRLFGWIIGQPPNLTRFHPRWADYTALLKVLRQTFDETAAGQNLLLVSDLATVVTTGLPNGGDAIHRMRTARLLAGSERRLVPLHRHFDVCLVELSENDLGLAGRIVERLELLIRDGGTLIVSVIPRRYTGDLGPLNSAFTDLLARLMRPSARSIMFECVPVNVLRRLANAGMTRLLARARSGRLVRYLVLPWLLPPILLLGWAREYDDPGTPQPDAVRPDLERPGHGRHR